MGGEREDYVTKKKSDKTESKSGTLGKYRYHENVGQFHVHDDELKLKAAVPMADWWKAWDKLKSGLGKWQWIDTVNDTILTIETVETGQPPGVDAVVTLVRGVFGPNFKALNAFTVRK